MVVDFQGLVLTEVDEFETTDGGRIVIGRCLQNEDHLVVFAHINLADAESLAHAIMTGIARFQKGGSA